MKKYVYTILCFLVLNCCFGQEVTLERNLMSNGGSSSNIDNIQLDYSIGEFIIGDFNVEGLQVSQGFLQQFNLSTSIEKHTLDVEISIFPNPAFQDININIKETGRFYIKLFSLEGKLVFEETTQGNTPLKIDMRSLARGLYNLEIVNFKGQSKALKLIKQ